VDGGDIELHGTTEQLRHPTLVESLEEAVNPSHHFEHGRIERHHLGKRLKKRHFLPSQQIRLRLREACANMGNGRQTGMN
jgi:hypothetical protein